jgi:nitroimidazol reductase NimA-like FMN-containing flavoprotein (pyridoxamine 5'-phosphate oxidase superfamily)
MPSDVTLDRNGLEVLDHDECMRLLGSVKIGRVGVSTDAMPVVLPVTFALDGDRIVFCSTPGTKLYTAREHAMVAFEADDIDADLRQGWSVCVAGPAAVVTEDADLDRVRRLPLHPWAQLDGASFVAIGCQLVTGRRVRRDGDRSA